MHRDRCRLNNGMSARGRPFPWADDHMLPHHEVRCAPQQNSLLIGSYVSRALASRAMSSSAGCGHWSGGEGEEGTATAGAPKRRARRRDLTCQPDRRHPASFPRQCQRLPLRQLTCLRRGASVPTFLCRGPHRPGLAICAGVALVGTVDPVPSASTRCGTRKAPG